MDTGDDLLQLSNMLDTEGNETSEKHIINFLWHFSYDFFIKISIMNTLCIKPYCIFTNKMNSLDTVLRMFVKHQIKLGCITTVIQLNHMLNDKTSRR